MADEDFSLVLFPNNAQQRVEVAGYPSLMSTFASGALQLTVPLGDGKQLRIVSFGIDPVQVADLVGATTVGSGYLPTFGTDANGALNGLNLIASAPTRQSGLGISSFLMYGGGSAHYQNPETGGFITIMSAPQSPNDLRIAALLVDNSTFPKSSAPSEMVSIEGRDVLVATMTFDDIHTYRVALWHAGAQTISIYGQLARDDLILAVRSSRLATADEWDAIVNAVPPVFTGEAESTCGSCSPEGPVRSEEIGAVTTTVGSAWTIRLTNENYGSDATASVQVEAPLTQESDSSFQPTSSVSLLPLPIDPINPLTHFETPTATILVAAFDAPTTAAVMRVTLYRRTPVDVPIVAVPETTLAGAAYVFSELVPYTVDLLDANGAIVQTLTP